MGEGTFRLFEKSKCVVWLNFNFGGTLGGEFCVDSKIKIKNKKWKFWSVCKNEYLLKDEMRTIGIQNKVFDLFHLQSFDFFIFCHAWRMLITKWIEKWWSAHQKHQFDILALLEAPFVFSL